MNKIYEDANVYLINNIIIYIYIYINEISYKIE